MTILGTMRRSVRSLVACLAACGRPALPGIVPDAEPRPPTVHAGGRFDGAALGWTLGSEVHVFIADDDVTRRVYALTVSPAMGGDYPTPFDSAFAGRRVLTLDGARVPGRDANPGYYDATILHRSGAVPAGLILIRLHRPGNCGIPGAVTELVYGFPQAALPAVPPAHTSVAALFRVPAYVRGGPPPNTIASLDRDAARRLATRVAQAGESLTAGSTPRAEPLARRLALDADLAADAGDVVPLAATPDRRYAVAVRARFRTVEGDTVFVSGIAITDTTLTGVHWVTRPVRARLARGLLANGVRYVLRGAVVYPPSGGELLLVDRIADVEAERARSLAVDPWTRRVVAAQPLALRCR